MHLIIMKVFLDNSSTTRLKDETKEYIIGLLDIFGNPSSLHSEGKKAKEIISNARKTVAKFINAKLDEIYFTGGGSASNTLAIRGYCERNNCNLFYSPIAHKSIIKCVNPYHNCFPLKVDSQGMINVKDLERQISKSDDLPFVVIDYANSEIGTVQQVEKIVQITHKYGGIVYLDCTGSIPTIPVDVSDIQADMIGFSAHKLGGLKGCGVLYKKASIQLEPLIYGNQEKGLIGGTENVVGIASLGKAIEQYDYKSVSSFNRDYVYDYISNNIPDCYVVGSLENRLVNNLYICFRGVEGESLMLMLDMNGIQVSTGSACNSGNLSSSPTLFEIGMDKNDVHSCIRLSFNCSESIEEIKYVCSTIRKCVNQLRELNSSYA